MITSAILPRCLRNGARDRRWIIFPMKGLHTTKETGPSSKKHLGDDLRPGMNAFILFHINFPLR